MVEEDLASAKSRKTWALVKFIFGAIFILIGISIYSSTGDVMNAWIYAGIAGIPSAFRNTRASRSEQLRNDVQDALTTDMMDSVSNWFIRLIVRLFMIILLAPITAVYHAIKNLVVFLRSNGNIKELQNAYDYLIAEDAAGEEPQQTVWNGSATPELPAQDTYQVPSESQQQETTQTEQSPYQPKSFIQPQPIPQPTVQPQPVASPAPQPAANSTYRPSAAAPTKKKVSLSVIGVIVGAVVLAIGLVTYFSWYVPYAKDRDALRTYVVATNVFLRSSQVAGVEYNVLDKLPYGSELITYNKGSEWSEVKVNGVKGYVASDYLLDAADFNLLHSAWGTLDSRDCIISSKCRMAILDYFKRHSLKGGSDGCQIFTKQKDVKPNSVFYPRLYNKNSKFTDFMFIVKDNRTGKRYLTCYSFEDETERPIFRFSMAAPAEGYIRNVQRTYSGASVLFDTGEKLNVAI